MNFFVIFIIRFDSDSKDIRVASSDAEEEEEEEEEEEVINYHTFKGRLQNPTAAWPAVPSGYGWLPLFRTIGTAGWVLKSSLIKFNANIKGAAHPE